MGIKTFLSTLVVFTSCTASLFYFQSPKKETTKKIETIPSGLTVTISRSSMPMAALEDLHLPTQDPLEEVLWKFPAYKTILVSGQKFSPPKPARTREAIVLQPIVIHKTSQETAKPKADRGDFNLSHQMQVRLKKTASVEKLWQETRQENIAGDEPLPTFDSMSRYLVEKALAEVSGEEITVVSRGQLATSAASKGLAKVIVAPATGEQDHRLSGATPQEEKKSVSAKVVNASEEAQKKSEQSLNNIFISGLLEMAGGLAYLGEANELLIYREVEGFYVEEGTAWLREGRYEIAIADNQGILVAQLKNASGDLIGETTYDLSLLSREFVDQGKVNGVDLVIQPLRQGIFGKVVSAYSFDQHEKLVAGAKVETSLFDEKLSVDEKGEFKYEDLARPSSYQMKASAEQHWGTLLVGSTGSAQTVRLFPDSMMEALIDLSSVFYDPEHVHRAIIWGKVEESGKPLSGARVELAGSDLRPIYFNALMIPDRSLRSTSSNGLFAYVGVPSGIHQIRADHGGRWLPAQVVPTEGRHVSHVLFKKVPTHQAPVRVFDAFEADQPLGAVLRIIGDENLVEVDSSGYGLLSLPLEKQLMFVEASSFDDYEAVRMIKSRSAKYLHLPMVRSQWLKKMASQNGLTLAAETGVVIGFISGEAAVNEYQVFLGNDSAPGSDDLIFFDVKGEPIDHAVIGGGFIIFNRTPGLQTVVVAPNSPLAPVSKVVFVEPGIISLLQHSFAQN